MIRLYAPTRKQTTTLLNNEIVVVPDQSLTLAQIIRKYTKGERIEVSERDAYYNDEGDEDLEKLRYQDLTVLQERMMESYSKYMQAEAKQKSEAEAKRKKEHDDLIESLVNQRLAEKQEAKPQVG